MTININRTNYKDEEIIAAVEAALDVGKYADIGNSAKAADPKAEYWEKIEYSLSVVMHDGERVRCIWRPTKESYKDAVERTDTGDICDWEIIDEAR